VHMCIFHCFFLFQASKWVCVIFIYL
jgi:hypothetical protein